MPLALLIGTLQQFPPVSGGDERGCEATRGSRPGRPRPGRALAAGVAVKLCCPQWAACKLKAPAL